MKRPHAGPGATAARPPAFPRLPTWIWKNSPICSRISLALACCFSPSMPAYGENGTNKPNTRGAFTFLAASPRSPPLSVQTALAWGPEDVLVVRPLARLFPRGPPACALRQEASACPAQLSLPAPAWIEWELGRGRGEQAVRPRASAPGLLRLSVKPPPSRPDGGHRAPPRRADPSHIPASAGLHKNLEGTPSSHRPLQTFSDLPGVTGQTADCPKLSALCRLPKSPIGGQQGVRGSLTIYMAAATGR